MLDEVEGNEELRGTSTANDLFWFPNSGSREEDAMLVRWWERRERYLREGDKLI